MFNKKTNPFWCGLPVLKTKPSETSFMMALLLSYISETGCASSLRTMLATSSSVSFSAWYFFNRKSCKSCFINTSSGSRVMVSPLRCGMPSCPKRSMMDCSSLASVYFIRVGSVLYSVLLPSISMFHFTDVNRSFIFTSASFTSLASGNRPYTKFLKSLS